VTRATTERVPSGTKEHTRLAQPRGLGPRPPGICRFSPIAWQLSCH
jgi:hypothetical protein